MSSESRLVHFGIWGLLALVVLSVCGVFISTLTRSRSTPLPIYGDAPDFHLTNQLNQIVSLADLRGHVWVADIIFTRCAGPCLQMTRKMKALQDGLAEHPSVRLISLTADPAFDTPAVLNQYAARFGSKPGQWQFLTGPKQDVYRLAIDGLKLAVQENPDAKADDSQFIHSTRFVLLDKKGQL